MLGVERLSAFFLQNLLRSNKAKREKIFLISFKLSAGL